MALIFKLFKHETFRHFLFSLLIRTAIVKNTTAGHLSNFFKPNVLFYARER